VTLESVRLRARRPDLDVPAVDHDLEAATNTLREAIDHLRRSSALGPSMFALGFVVEAVA
jgi:hypothetical protein